MDPRFYIPNIHVALREQILPSVVIWNRVEPRPRTPDFSRALAAEVRDALWMLARQWQMGEFHGDDAASPVAARLATGNSRLTAWQPREGTPRPLDPAVPLEPVVEARPIVWEAAQRPLALDLRLQLGRQWLKLIRGIGGGYAAEYRTAYPLAEANPANPADAPLAAHFETRQWLAAVAGRAMDGGAFLLHLEGDPTRAADGIALADPAHAPLLHEATRTFLACFTRLYLQPGEKSAWDSARLEYRFSVSAPAGNPGDPAQDLFVAEEYYHGHLDWYNFEVDRDAPPMPEPVPAPPDPRARGMRALIPAPLRFNGMPNTRWWTFEDGRTNFGEVRPATTDLAKMLLVEFGLIYGNDWFLLPLTTSAGGVNYVRGLAITNVFGERIWIEPAGKGIDDVWQRWSVFSINERGDDLRPAEVGLLVPPSAAKVQESAPLEEVLFIRDEVANLVWGIETIVPLASGAGTPGSEAAREILAFHRARVNAAPAPQPPPVAAILYQVMNSVPEEWIPFIAVHRPGETRQIQLQRAGLLRTIEGDPQPPQKVGPRTTLLREGLDQAAPQPYFVHEEEVPRAGVRVRRVFKRTRASDGRVFVWLANTKQVGRGEGSSDLAFDQIVNSQPQGA